jgi:hypothetical protein
VLICGSRHAQAQGLCMGCGSCSTATVRVHVQLRTLPVQARQCENTALPNGKAVHHALPVQARQCKKHCLAKWQGSASCTACPGKAVQKAVHDALPCQMCRQCIMHCLSRQARQCRKHEWTNVPSVHACVVCLALHAT